MQNKKWKKFGTLTGKCYLNMAGAEKDGSCWEQAFELLKEIIREERQKNPEFALTMEEIDDATDYSYDIESWMEDCLDEIDMRENYKLLLQMCEDLLNLFDWPDYTGSDLKFRKSIALRQLGQNKESAKYCKEWIQNEPENMVAATAGVYAYTEVGEFDAAEELIDRFIFDLSKCSEENDIMFTAAARFYEATGNQEKQKQADQALEEYDEYLGEYFGMDELDMDEWDMDLLDDELPFN